MNNEVIAKLIMKYQSKVLELVKEAKGSTDYESIGKKTVELINDITNIKLGDFL